jgi:hypothetical protein
MNRWDERVAKWRERANAALTHSSGMELTKVASGA